MIIFLHPMIHIRIYPRMLFLRCSLLILLLPACSQQADTIRQGESLRDGETLVSSDEVFALGFFSRGASKNRYLGIWYNELSNDTIVWIANRDDPVQDSSGIVTITRNGNLAVVDGRENTIWSASISTTGLAAGNTSLTLMDSGNLVLQHSSRNTTILWQSFNLPTHTILPGGMKLWLDLRSGSNTVLRSWRNAEDPGTGIYSFGIDPQHMTQVVIWRQSIRMYRSGTWNRRAFEGFNYSRSSIFRYIFTVNENEASYSYDTVSKSIIARYVLDMDGQLKVFTWDEQRRDWDLYWTGQSSVYDVYNRCKEYGVCSNTNESFCSCLKGFESKIMTDKQDDWPWKCERKVSLECRVDDVFEQMTNLKLPDWFNIYSSATTVKDCEGVCRRNCSCTAYAFADIGIGRKQCLVWDGDLVDLVRFSDEGDDLYVRLASPQADSSSDNNSKLGVSFGIGVPGLIAVAIGAVCLWKLKSRKDNKIKNRDMSIFGALRGRISAKNGEISKKETDFALYSFESISNATNCFSLANKLGEGGFGPVYKGKLEEGQEIAVKRLSRTSGQGLIELKNEVMLICKLQHRNLVRLLGCCIDEDEKILIYEYMPNKSLDSWLFDKTRSACLDWPRRVHILEGIARGLLYLHHDSRLRIIHRDLKASNILLDEEMIPKISDFGMAKIFGSDQNQANTNRVVGTYGYMSPEYAMKGLFSAKSDVFSFGVLLLEILSGMRNNRSVDLLGHAWKLWNGGFGSEFVASSLGDTCPNGDVLRYMLVGLLCVQGRPDERPSMPQVVIMLGSETANLPSPKEPITCYQNWLSDSNASPTTHGSSSINDITITSLDAR